jgi:hypothetical protein
MRPTGDGLPKWRAPQKNGQRIVDPEFDAAVEATLANARRLQSIDVDLQGRRFQDLRCEARRDLVELANSYTQQDADSEVNTRTNPIVLTGHQPELFHPGVWFKNFVANRLGRRLGGLAVHLLIDNDLARASGIRVPGGSAAHPELRFVEYDRYETPVAHEEQTVQDDAFFRSFAERVDRILGPLIPEPLLKEVWPVVCTASGSRQRIGEALAAGRRHIERQWGVHNLEIPFSTICQTTSFRWFAVHLLAQLPTLQRIYNDQLEIYRRANRIRSQSHPVPSLRTDGEWLEAPFWIWTADQPQRRPLFARRFEAGIELSDRNQVSLSLPVTEDRDGASAVARLTEEVGLKLRPRALLTTMFARLFLGDQFIHGIGGAKYDQLTDAIAAHFFQTPAPPFVVASATAQLPIERPDVSAEDLRELNRQIREFEYHPEMFVESNSQTASLVATKRRWIAKSLPHGGRRERHEAITRANEALRQYLKTRESALIERRGLLQMRARDTRLLSSREFAFVLFPGKTLARFLLDI